MSTIFMKGVIVGAVMIVGFFALNAYIYNEKQGEGTQPDSVMQDDVAPTDSVDITESSTSAQPDVLPTISGKTLDLSGKGLTKVPESIFKQTDVEVLDLSGNKLTGALQAEIRFMKNLRSLDLSNNEFTGVPAEIGQLSKLEYLNLSGNPLTGLPYELGNLVNLKVLDVRDTNYSSQDLDTIQSKLNTATDVLTK